MNGSTAFDLPSGGMTRPTVLDGPDETSHIRLLKTWKPNDQEDHP